MKKRFLNKLMIGKSLIKIVFFILVGSLVLFSPTVAWGRQVGPGERCIQGEDLCSAFDDGTLTFCLFDTDGFTKCLRNNLPLENNPPAEFNPLSNVTDEDFDAFNPLKTADQIAGSDVDPASLSTPGGIISRVLEFAFPLAGLILFVMITWGGFEMLYGASTSKAMEAGRQRVTASLIGFFLLFASYWIIQILEVVFGIGILR